MFLDGHDGVADATPLMVQFGMEGKDTVFTTILDKAPFLLHIYSIGRAWFIK
jgi:hypothetical protein